MDLDQGGTIQQWERVFMGPTIGWQLRPTRNTLSIVTGGTFIVDPAISYITVNTTGSVTLILPSAINPPAGAQPGLSVDNTVVIVDAGGNAQLHPITIQRNNSGESIMGLASIQITVNYGGYTLSPNSAQATWNLISP